MDEKAKELIAIGASVAAHCQPCLTYHLAKALELKITEQQIREAISVGEMVSKGAESAMRNFSRSVFDMPQEKAASCCSGTEASGKKSCCN